MSSKRPMRCWYEAEWDSGLAGEGVAGRRLGSAELNPEHRHSGDQWADAVDDDVDVSDDD